MSDWTPVVVAVLVGCAVAFALMSIVGRADSSRPQCRTCRRDARPYGWREPCVCDCGANLASSNAVCVARRRRWRGAVAAIVLIAACVAIVAYDVRMRESGRQWRDLVPAGIFGWMLREIPSTENLTSLDARFTDGMSPNSAQAFLAALAKPSTNRTAHRETLMDITDSVVEAIGPLRLDPSVVSLLDGGLAFDVIATEENDETILVPHCARLQNATTTLLRVDAIESGERSLPWHAHDNSGRRYDGWFPLAGGVVLRVRGIVPGAASALVVRGETLVFLAARTMLPIQAGDDAAAGTDPIILHPETWPMTPTTGTFAIEVTKQLAPTPSSSPPAATATRGRQWWPGWSWRGIEFDRRITLAPCLNAAIGTACGVAVGFACVWFGLNAGRGWPGLERPRCARCRSLLRGEGESLPPRCPECGADMSSRGAILWLRRHRSRVSLAITVPVACIGGMVLGVAIGAQAARMARAVTDRAFGDDAAHLISLMDRWEGDDRLQRGAARDAIQRLLVQERRLFDRETMTEVFDRLRTRLAMLDHEGEDYEEQWVAALGLQILNRLVEREFIDRATADATMRAAIRPASLIIPHLVLASDPIPVIVRGFWPNVVVARVTVDGGAPTWLIGRGRRESLPAIDTPGVHEVIVECAEQVVEVFPGALVQSPTPTALDDFFEHATVRRREVLRIEVTDDLQRLAEPITDPAFDPFAPGDARVLVTMMARGGARQVDIWPDGPRAGLLVGQWTVTIDGIEYPLPVGQPGVGAARLLPDGELPKSIELRFTPKAPQKLTSSLAFSIDGLRFERPRWGVERAMRCERVDLPSTGGPLRATYSVRRDSSRSDE